jgi:hypothetical protein
MGYSSRARQSDEPKFPWITLFIILIAYGILIIGNVISWLFHIHNCNKIINTCMFICHGNYSYYQYTCYSNSSYIINTPSPDYCINRCLTL